MLLVIGLVYLSRPARQTRLEPPSALRAASVKAGPDFPSAAPARYDFTSMLDAPQPGVPAARDILAYGPRPVEGRADYAPGRVPARAAASRLLGAVSSPAASAAVLGRKTAAAAASPGRSASVSKKYGAGVSSGGGYADLSSYEEGGEASSARRQMFDGYAPRQTRQQQKALDFKLKNMSSGIERAIARAMAPKSKREQNIEKYLGRTRGEAAAMDGGVYGAETGQMAAPEADVTNQIAAQAAGVVDGVRSSYGDQAAERAGKIMDNFQKEMSDTLNAPGDPQEKQIRANAVNNKYNQQLQNLNREEALNKMEAEMRAANEKQLAAIGEKFNPETAAAARAKMEENLQKRMAVYRAGGSEEDVYKQLLALDEQQRKDLEQIVREKNADDPQAAAKLLELQNENVKQQIEEEEQAIKEGRKQARDFRLKEKTVEVLDASWKKDNKEITDFFAAFGPEQAAKAKQILEKLRQDRNAIYRSGASVSEINKANMKATDAANAELKKLEEESKRGLVQNQENQLNARNEEVLSHYTAQMQGVPDEVKAQWAARAKPVLEKYNRQRAQLALTARGEEEYKAALEQLAASELDELKKISVPSSSAPEQ